MKFGSFTLAVLAVVGTAELSFAGETFTVPHTVNLSEYNFGHDIDIVGLKPGQSAADVKDILKERFGEFRGQSMRIGTDQVSSEKFDVTYAAGQRDKEQVQVFLTSPSAGNQVFAAGRVLDFRTSDGLPAITDLVAKLSEKYGEPTNFTPEGRKGPTAVWYLGSKGKCDLKDTISYRPSWICDEPYFSYRLNDGKVYNIRAAQEYADTMNAGADVILVAKFTSFDHNGKANSMAVSFVDVKRRGLSLEADLKLIDAEQAKFDSKSVAMPDL
jgi:hypothetical protein